MELARRHLLNFTEYTFPGFERSWHHEAMCNILDKFADPNSGLDNLMIFTAPRHTKSELVSRRLPSFLLGRNPDAKIIAASYGQALADSMSRDVQRIMSGTEYQELFPGSYLPPNSGRGSNYVMRTADMFEIPGRRGFYKGVGVMGSVTGYGSQYLIIDDPIKNAADAASKTLQDSTLEWYVSTLLTRRERGGKVLLTNTRWSANDLAGKLLQMAKEDPNAQQWEVVSLPAISTGNPSPYDQRKEAGIALWEARFPLDKLQELKTTMGTAAFNCLYQQDPAIEGGNIFKRAWFDRYLADPKEVAASCDYLIASWDLSFTGKVNSDYNVGEVWGVMSSSKEFYLIDLVRRRADFTQTVGLIKSMNMRWAGKLAATYVEEKANGSAILSHLKKEIPGMIGITPHDSKVVRAQAVSPLLEAHNCKFPLAKYAPWVEDFIDELTGFPDASPNDDMVDALTQALSVIQRKVSIGGAKPVGPIVNERPDVYNHGLDNSFGQASAFALHDLLVQPRRKDNFRNIIYPQHC